MGEEDIEQGIKEVEIKKKYYVWTCPICGKELMDVSKSRLIFNAKVHLLTHRKRE